MECLKWLHENNMCPWDEEMCEYAAENGQLECLKYAHENGCPWDREDVHESRLEWTFGVFEVRARERVSLERGHVRVCRQNGHLECLKYARENGCPWDKETCECAAEWTFGVFEVRARDTGVLGTRGRARMPPEWTFGVFEVRARARVSLEQVDVQEAAWNGHLECLRYAREHGCPWDGWTCAEAAKYGQLECLKYAHDKRVSLGQGDVHDGRPEWAFGLFEVRARERVSLEPEGVRVRRREQKFGVSRVRGTSRARARTSEIRVSRPSIARNRRRHRPPTSENALALEMALSYNRHGFVSLREILPFWREHRTRTRRAPENRADGRVAILRRTKIAPKPLKRYALAVAADSIAASTRPRPPETRPLQKRDRFRNETARTHGLQKSSR